MLWAVPVISVTQLLLKAAIKRNELVYINCLAHTNQEIHTSFQRNIVELIEDF